MVYFGNHVYRIGLQAPPPDGVGYVVTSVIYFVFAGQIFSHLLVLGFRFILDFAHSNIHILSAEVYG